MWLTVLLFPLNSLWCVRHVARVGVMKKAGTNLYLNLQGEKKIRAHLRGFLNCAFEVTSSSILHVPTSSMFWSKPTNGATYIMKVHVLKLNSIVQIRLLPDRIQYPNNTLIACNGRTLVRNKDTWLPTTNIRTHTPVYKASTERYIIFHLSHGSVHVC